MGEDKDSSLAELGERIKKAKKSVEAGDEGGRSGMGATRVSVELLAGVATGCVMGFFVDRWLDTKPVFFLIGFFLGVAAGALNIYKLASKNNHYTDK